MSVPEEEEILYENDRISFQFDVDNIIEEVAQQDQAYHARPQDVHAFRQDDLDLPFGNPSEDQESRRQVPEWIMRNKKLGAITKFFTLEGIHEPKEENGDLMRIGVPDFYEDKNFYLDQIFDEDERRQAQIQGHGRVNNMNQPRLQNSGGLPNSHQVVQSKTSFFKEFLPGMLDHHWVEVMKDPDRFREFENSFDVHKNIENMLFLEENRQSSQRSFENIFAEQYKQMIQQFKSSVQNGTLSPEDLIKIMYENSCQMMFWMFTYVQGCSGDYCWEQIKNKGNTRNNIHLEENKISENNLYYPASNENFPTPQNKMKIEDGKKIDSNSLIQMLSNQPRPIGVQKNEENINRINMQNGDSQSISDLESVTSEAKRMQRKYWSEREQEELEALANQYYPGSIPIDKLDEFARRNGRTLNAVQSKISKTKKSKLRPEESDSLSISSAGRANQERIVKSALAKMLDRTGTKEQIIEKIMEINYPNQRPPNEESMKNSFSQIISSCKDIEKIKGTYRLQSQRHKITDPSKALTMKTRLQYILSHLENNRGETKLIRELYEQNFPNICASDPNWQTSIVKTLRQNSEFDSSDSKTKYRLILNPPG